MNRYQYNFFSCFSLHFTKTTHTKKERKKTMVEEKQNKSILLLLRFVAIHIYLVWLVQTWMRRSHFVFIFVFRAFCSFNLRCTKDLTTICFDNYDKQSLWSASGFPYDLRRFSIEFINSSWLFVLSKWPRYILFDFHSFCWL